MQLKLNDVVELLEDVEVAENAPYFRGCILSRSQELKSKLIPAGTKLVVQDISESFALHFNFGISWPAHVELTTINDGTLVLVNLAEITRLLKHTGETLSRTVRVLLTNYVLKNGIKAIYANTKEEEGVELDYVVKEKTEEGLYIELDTDLDVSVIEQISIELKEEQGTFVYIKTSKDEYSWDLQQSVVRNRLGKWFDNPRGKRYLKVVN